MKKKIVIVANLELDSCLAVSLLIKNLSYVDETKKYCPPSCSLEYIDLYPGENIFEVINDYEDNWQPDEGESDEPESVPIVCFRDDFSFIDTLKELEGLPAILYFIGYKKKLITEGLKVLDKNQQVFCTSEFCSAEAISKQIRKNLKRDNYSNVRFSAAHILYEEYYDIVLDYKYPISQRVRSKAQKIIDLYVDTWAIAYNIFNDDANKLTRFHFEYLEELIFEEPNKFIDDLFGLAPEMEVETEKLRHKQVLYQGQGIFLIKTGSKKSFKAQILLEMLQKGYPFPAIEYISKSKKKLMTMDFDQKIYFEEGPFQKCELVGKN